MSLLQRISIATMAFLTLAATGLADEPIVWRDNLQEATAEVRAQQRPLLLLFTMDGCGYCQLMKRTTYADAQVAASIQQGFVAARVDGQTHRRLAQRLGIRVYPTTVIISPENRVIDRMDGYVKPNAFLPRLTTATQTVQQARTDSPPVR